MAAIKSSVELLGPFRTQVPSSITCRDGPSTVQGADGKNGHIIVLRPLTRGGGEQKTYNFCYNLHSPRLMDDIGSRFQLTAEQTRQLREYVMQYQRSSTSRKEEKEEEWDESPEEWDEEKDDREGEGDDREIEMDEADSSWLAMSDVEKFNELKRMWRDGLVGSARLESTLLEDTNESQYPGASEIARSEACPSFNIIEQEDFAPEEMGGLVRIRTTDRATLECYRPTDLYNILLGAKDSGAHPASPLSRLPFTSEADLELIRQLYCEDQKMGPHCDAKPLTGWEGKQQRRLRDASVAVAREMEQQYQLEDAQAPLPPAAAYGGGGGGLHHEVDNVAVAAGILRLLESGIIDDQQAAELLGDIVQ